MMSELSKSLNTRHHLLFPAAEWSLRKEAHDIRTTASMKPRMSVEDHAYLHQQVAIVPLLGYRTLMTVKSIWTPEGDTLRDLNQLCEAIGRAATHQKSHEIESALAHLTIQALKMELEILQEVEFK